MSEYLARISKEEAISILEGGQALFGWLLLGETYEDALVLGRRWL